MLFLQHEYISCFNNNLTHHTPDFKSIFSFQEYYSLIEKMFSLFLCWPQNVFLISNVMILFKKTYLTLNSQRFWTLHSLFLFKNSFVHFFLEDRPSFPEQPSFFNHPFLISTYFFTKDFCITQKLQNLTSWLQFTWSRNEFVG